MSTFGYLATSVPIRLASSGSVVAIPILSVHELGDVTTGGVLVAASLAPAVLAAPLVGVALDRSRHPRRLIMIAAVVTFLGFAAVSILGILPLPVIIALLFAAGLAAPFMFGGLSSFVTDAIPGERRAYALDALSYNIASVAGPAIVAFAALTGIDRLGMLLMAAGALVGAIGTIGLVAPARPATDATFLGTIVAGLRHLTFHRPLVVVTSSGTLNAIGSGALPIAAVALAIERSGSASDGALIVTAFAIGGLLGSLIAALRPSTRFTPQLVMGTGLAAIGVFTLVAIPDFGIAWTIAAIGISGLFTASSNAAMLLLRKQQSPLNVRSQVFTIGSGLRAMSGGAGAAIAGLLAGLPAGLLVAGIGIAWLLSAGIMLAYPRGAEPLPDSDLVVPTAAR
jgi:MFS family permease